MQAQRKIKKLGFILLPRFYFKLLIIVNGFAWDDVPEGVFPQKSWIAKEVGLVLIKLNLVHKNTK